MSKHYNSKNYNCLADQVRWSSSVMKVIVGFMPKRDLLIPGFRDVVGVRSALFERVKTGEYDKLLLSAAKRGLTSIVKILLDAGADKDVKNKDRETPLHYAAIFGRTDIVKLLLDAGADKYVKTKNGWIPLQYALYFGDMSYTEVKNLLK